MKPNPVIHILDYIAIRAMLLQRFPFPTDVFKATRERVGITIAGITRRGSERGTTSATQRIHCQRRKFVTQVTEFVKFAVNSWRFSRPIVLAERSREASVSIFQPEILYPYVALSSFGIYSAVLYRQPKRWAEANRQLCFLFSS